MINEKEAISELIKIGFNTKEQIEENKKFIKKYNSLKPIK